MRAQTRKRNRPAKADLKRLFAMIEYSLGAVLSRLDVIGKLTSQAARGVASLHMRCVGYSRLRACPLGEKGVTYADLHGDLVKSEDEDGDPVKLVEPIVNCWGTTFSIAGAERVLQATASIETDR